MICSATHNTIIAKLAYFQLRTIMLHTTFPYTYLKAFKNKGCTELLYQLLGAKSMVC